jgi:hypothetical protein
MEKEKPASGESASRKHDSEEAGLCDDLEELQDTAISPIKAAAVGKSAEREMSSAQKQLHLSSPVAVPLPHPQYVNPRE